MCRFHTASEETPIGGVSSANERDILPGWLVPSHYDVWLAPSLESFTFDGTIAIDVDVKEDTFKAVLNAKDLTVHKASVTVNGEKQDAIAITYDKEKEQVTFEFANDVASLAHSSHLTGKTGATKHVLSDKEDTITFPYDSLSSGAFWKLNENASGLYRV
ncbi:hypothetical protein BC830DRAFT_1078859, partial [Chytriomyces sp. MP71]